METVVLDKVAEDYLNRKKALSHRIVICAGTGCIANGAMEVHAALQEIIKEKDIPPDPLS